MAQCDCGSTDIDANGFCNDCDKDVEHKRYIVRGTDHDQEEADVISRPEVFDIKANTSVGGRWYLNDWDRAQAFANELNSRERLVVANVLTSEH